MGRAQGWILTVLGGASMLGAGCYSGAGEADGLPPAGADSGESGADSEGEGDSDGDPPEGQCEGSGAVVRRLTTLEYAHTVFDTLGVDIAADAEARLPADLRSDGFSNQISGLLVSFSHVEAYRDLAKLIVAQLPDLPGLVDAHTSCTDFADGCESSFIEGLGARVWRRPLAADEVASLRPIFTAAHDEGDDFVTAAGLVLEAMLQAPQFVYRLEDELPGSGAPGELRVLGDYEIASRLSYLLWSTSPDDVLFDAARAGELHTAQQIEAQVDRMLASPRAKDTALRYIDDWLALGGLPQLNRSPELYPEFSEALARDMREETLRVAEELLWEREAPLIDLLTADFTWASPALASLYGIESPGEGWQRYSLDDVPHRQGILTHAGVQAINGHGDQPSLVERGLFILGGVLCSSVAAPPAELDTTMSELETGRSPRYYSEARLDNATCNACHGQFDPMGWAFEPFDGIGAWHDQDIEGNELREDGWLVIPGSAESVPFDTVEEFSELLAQSEHVAECIGVRNPLQFAMGRPLGSADACAEQEIALSAAEGGGSYQALVRAIATHPSFQTIRSDD